MTKRIIHARLEYLGDSSQMTPWIVDITYTDGSRDRFGFFMGSWQRHFDYILERL